MISYVLMLSKVRNLLIFWERIPPSQSEAQSRERIGSRSGVDPLSKSCDLSEPIRGSESQNGSAPNPLPRGSAPQKSCDLSKPIRCALKSLTSC